MKPLMLGNGYLALVDEGDFDRLAQFTWTAHKQHGRQVYAVRGIGDGKKAKLIYIHHEIIGFPKSGLEVDHINNCGLDNRRENLRFATHMQNTWNIYAPSGVSRYLGVYPRSDGKAWVAQIRVDRKTQYLGSFDTEEAAAIEYDRVSLKTRGEFARLNFPSTGDTP